MEITAKSDLKLRDFQKKTEMLLCGVEN